MGDKPATKRSGTEPLNNIPKELRELDRWQPAKPEPGGKKKISDPFDLKGWASSNRPETWTDFDHVTAIQEEHRQYTLRSMVIPPGYCCIDVDHVDDEEFPANVRAILDDLIANHKGYAELSQSKNGYHFFVKEEVTKHLSGNAYLQIFGAEHFLITTGYILEGRPTTIEANPDLIKAISDDLGLAESTWQGCFDPAVLAEVDGPAKEELDALHERVSTTVGNAEKFNELFNSDEANPDFVNATCSGDFSRAEFALLQMMTHYSPSYDQVAAWFKRSKLYARVNKSGLRKTHKTRLHGGIVKNMIIHSVEKKEAMELDRRLSVQADATAAKLRKEVGMDLTPFRKELARYRPSEVSACMDDEEYFPPGLVGDIARYIYTISHKQVKEMALAGALLFVGGVAQRQFNVSKTGLNQYMIVLAGSGAGKEGIAAGIDYLLAAVNRREAGLDASKFRGPGAYASGQALRRIVSEQKCVFSLLGEFGFTLKRLSVEPLFGPDGEFKQAILDLYAKSGRDRDNEKKAYAKEENDLNGHKSPAFTMLGESTPDIVYEQVTEEMIKVGFIPRFLLMEVLSDSPYRNRSPEVMSPPADWLVDNVVAFIKRVRELESKEESVEIKFSEEATDLDIEFERWITDVQNDPEKRHAYKLLWSRADVKAMKLAAILAVGQNFDTPEITEKDMAWGIDFAKKSANILGQRYERGELSGVDMKRITTVKKVAINFLTKPNKDKKLEALRLANVIPRRRFTQGIARAAEFAPPNDHTTRSKLLDDTLISLCKDAELILIPELKMKQDYGTSSVAYRPGPELLSSHLAE